MSIHKKLRYIFQFAALLILASCTGHPTQSHQAPLPPALGEVVDELGSNIMSIYQAKNDVYWFGSWKTGVYKYDGETIVHFTTEDGLANNRIDEIKEDEQGNIYFSSCHPSSTVVKYDGKAFITLKATTSDAWELNATDVWFKHAYGVEKVYRYDGETLHELQLPKPPSLGNPFEVYSIYKDSQGNIWFGTNPSGVCRYDGNAFDWITEEDVTEFRNEGANGVRSIAEDNNGDFWFNTENRYSIYDSTTLNSNNFYTRHLSIGDLNGQPNSGLNEYLSTVKDHQGNLWFVTYLDGVWKYDGSNITHYPILKDGEQITLFSIYQDNHNVLWLGTHEDGVYWFDGEGFVRK